MKATVEIKRPCYEALENRKPGEAGNYCKSCQTLVIDFTGMTPDEISAYFLNSNRSGKICGTYARSVVKTDNTLDNFISGLHRGKLKFMAVLLIGILVLTGCRTKKSATFTGQRTIQLDEKTESTENLK